MIFVGLHSRPENQKKSRKNQFHKIFTNKIFREIKFSEKIWHLCSKFCQNQVKPC